MINIILDRSRPFYRTMAETISALSIYLFYLGFVTEAFPNKAIREFKHSQRIIGKAVCVAPALQMHDYCTSENLISN